MGYRNHLHVCQHCGVVHATSSSTGPEACVVCEAFTFSEYEPNDRLRERRDPEARPIDDAVERTRSISPAVGRLRDGPSEPSEKRVSRYTSYEERSRHE